MQSKCHSLDYLHLSWFCHVSWDTLHLTLYYFKDFNQLITKGFKKSKRAQPLLYSDHSKTDKIVSWIVLKNAQNYLYLIICRYKLRIWFLTVIFLYYLYLKKVDGREGGGQKIYYSLLDRETICTHSVKQLQEFL